MRSEEVSRKKRFSPWILLPVLVGGLAAVAGVGIVPGVSGRVGPTLVALRLVPGVGETSIRVTPLGTVAANTHSFPTRIELSLVEADIEDLGRAATSPQGRDDLREDVTRDLRALALRAALRLSLAACLLAAAACALLFGRHPSVILAAVGGCAIAAATMAFSITSTFDSRAFNQPSYSGALAKAQQVIEVVARGEELLDKTRSRFDVASRRLSDLFVLLAEPDNDPRQAGTVLLHVSDIHANPIGFEITRDLAEEFDADAVLDTGDVGSAELDTGALSSAVDPVDRAIARQIAGIGVPYIYVPGNHDSPQLRRRIAAIDSVTLLDGSVTTVDALKIMGYADPTFSTSPIPEDEKSQQRFDMAPQVAERVVEEQPDILAVHDPVLASGSWGSVPLILAGHTHERGEILETGTLQLTVGSTGATGLKHLTLEAGRGYEAQILYFEGDHLSAVDYISLTNVAGDFELSRRTYSSPVRPFPADTPRSLSQLRP